jgi:hypothetical protein
MVRVSYEYDDSEITNFDGKKELVPTIEEDGPNNDNKHRLCLFFFHARIEYLQFCKVLRNTPQWNDMFMDMQAEGVIFLDVHAAGHKDMVKQVLFTGDNGTELYETLVGWHDIFPHS